MNQISVLKKVRTNGVLVLVEACIASMLAAAVLFQISWLWALGYLLMCAVGCGSIIYAYCAKCPCRANCGHVVPGKIAIALTHRDTSPYTMLEIGVVGVAVTLMYALPVFWLWRSPIVFAPYALLMLVAFLQAQIVLCRNCNNIYCPARKDGA